MAALVSKHLHTYLQHDNMYVIGYIPVMFFNICSTDPGTQVQKLRRTSPIKDTHTAKVETLTKEKEGKHKGDGDETSMLTFMHGPDLLTELAHEVSQLKMQLQKLTTAPLAKVRACYRWYGWQWFSLLFVPVSFTYFFVTFTWRALFKHSPWPLPVLLVQQVSENNNTLCILLILLYPKQQLHFAVKTHSF